MYVVTGLHNFLLRQKTSRMENFIVFEEEVLVRAKERIEWIFQVENSSDSREICKIAVQAMWEVYKTYKNENEEGWE